MRVRVLEMRSMPPAVRRTGRDGLTRNSNPLNVAYVLAFIINAGHSQKSGVRIQLEELLIVKSTLRNEVHQHRRQVGKSESTPNAPAHNRME